MFMNSNENVKGWMWGFWTHQVAYWPVALTWIAISIFKSEMLRESFQISTIVSLFGPFTGYWVSLAFAFVHADDNDLLERWELWVGVASWLCYTALSMFMQGTLVTKIINEPNSDSNSDNKNGNNDDIDWSDVSLIA